jgi:hypothetical protein
VLQVVFSKLLGEWFAVRLFFFILVAPIVGGGLGYFGRDLVFAADKTELTLPAPDPDAKFVKPPKPGQSFGCDPLADGNVFDDRFSHKATVWTKYEAHRKLLSKSAMMASAFRS